MQAKSTRNGRHQSRFFIGKPDDEGDLKGAVPEGVEICAAQDAQGQEQHHEPDQKNETVDTGDGQK